MYQSSISSLIDYFKIDNRSITTPFQGEVKYLNLTNYHSQGLLICLGPLSMRLSNL